MSSFISSSIQVDHYRDSDGVEDIYLNDEQKTQLFVKKDRNGAIVLIADIDYRTVSMIKHNENSSIVVLCWHRPTLQQRWFVVLCLYTYKYLSLFEDDNLDMQALNE